MGKHLVIVGAGHAHLTVLKNLERKLRQYLDPEAVDALAKADQAELVRRFGGREKAFRTGTKGATPAPGQSSE